MAGLAADWDRQKALDAATQILTAHPDMKAIYAANDDMAVGVSIAIGRAGKTGKVLPRSGNGAPYGIDLIKQGKMTLTNGNPPSIASVQSFRLLLGVLDKTVQPGQFYAAPDRAHHPRKPGDALGCEAIPTSLDDSRRKEPLPQPAPPPTPPAKCSHGA